MMMNLDYMRITSVGWKKLPHLIQARKNTIITEPEKTMEMLTINGRLWAEKWWWL